MRQPHLLQQSPAGLISSGPGEHGTGAARDGAPADSVARIDGTHTCLGGERRDDFAGPYHVAPDGGWDFSGSSPRELQAAISRQELVDTVDGYERTPRWRVRDLDG